MVVRDSPEYVAPCHILAYKYLHVSPRSRFSLIMNRSRIIPATVVLLLCPLSLLQLPAAEINKDSGPEIVNRLTYLDTAEPFYVGRDFPKLTTPQWVGEPGVDTAIILAVDDMTEPPRYEAFLRPLLERLKQIDGRAPVSIMTRSVSVNDPQVQRWIQEGVSIEVHTLNHPCPLLANGDFEAAVTNV